MHDHRETTTAPRPPTGRQRIAATTVRLARHGRRFTGAILLSAAVVGVGLGVAAPEVSPVAPTTTTVAVAAAAAAAAAQTPDQTVAAADPGRDGGGRGADGGRGDGGGGGRR